jgi:uncharacterized membrane protein
MLTGLIAKFFGARALKAVVGGLTTTAVAGAFTEGFSTGLTPFAHDFGLQLGTAIGTFLIGHVLVYIFPNKPAKSG